MSDVRVRQALLADIFAITDAYCSNVDVFTRWNHDGTRTVVPYAEMSLAERFENGGPWMSVETCAVWLAHLLRHGDEIPLVVEVDGVVLGEAEATIGEEPSPYGKHLNISSLCIHADAHRNGFGTALIDYIKEMAGVMSARWVTVPFAAEANEFLSMQGFRPLAARRQVIVPARQGRVFYKALDMDNYSPSQISGWHMPIGRFQNARHEWNRILPGFWNGVPELVEPRVHRFIINITNQPGILLLEEERKVPGRANVYLWTKQPVSTHMISAIRDRSAQLGYTELSMYVDDAVMAMIEPEATDVRDAEVLLASSV